MSDLAINLQRTRSRNPILFMSQTEETNFLVAMRLAPKRLLDTTFTCSQLEEFSYIRSALLGVFTNRHYPGPLKALQEVLSGKHP